MLSLSNFTRRFHNKNITFFARAPITLPLSFTTGTLHIAINYAIINPNINFDYIFIQDYDRFLVEYIKARNLVSKVILGRHFSYPHLEISDSAIKPLFEYRVASLRTACKCSFSDNIANGPICDMSSTIFAAVQLVLACHPKKIYLVGFDCTKANASPEQPENRDYDALIPAWRQFAFFARQNYPDVEICVLNPIGLKGIFDEAAFPSKTTKDSDNQDATSTLLREANEYDLAGDYASSLARAQTAMRLNPDSFEAHTFTALLIRRYFNGNYWQKWLFAQELPCLHLFTANRLFRFANANFAKKNFIEAFACYADALALDPANQRIRARYASALRSCKISAHSMTITMTGLQMDPEWANGHCQLALYFKSLKKFHKAKKHIRKALIMKPDAHMWRLYYCQILRATGNIKAADDLLHESLAFWPEWPDGLYQQSINRISLGKISDAIELGKMAVDLIPTWLAFDGEYRKSILHYARLLAANCKRLEAKAVLEKYHSVFPTWQEAAKMIEDI